MDVVFQMYQSAGSRRDFFRKLEQSGLRLSYKQGRVIGFRDAGGRKFSLRRIGINEQKLAHLDTKQERELLRINERLNRLAEKGPKKLELKPGKKLSPYQKR